jgi:sulfoxide reductase heme-binding subunit YedZ
MLAAATSGPSPLWYATRATGVVALVLLTITVALGIAGVSRLESRQWPRVITAGLHKNISLLVVAFVIVHVLTTVLDSFVSISPVAAIIPFASSYRTFWLGLGAIAFDLILALVATSLLRSRLSYRAWRGVHLLAYASWPIALWHGLGTGTDTKLPWLLAIDALCVITVAGALVWRSQLMAAGTWRTVAIASAVALPMATTLFAIAGPLRAGWAARAGTPAAALGQGHASTDAARASWMPFTGDMTVTPVAGSDQEVIIVQARIASNPAEDLTVILRGTKDDAGIEMSAGSVRVTSVTGGPSWAGPVTSLNGARVSAILHGPGGATEQAHLRLRISGPRVAGQVLIDREMPR